MRKSRIQSAGKKLFTDDFLDWMGSPEGQGYIDLSDQLWPLMSEVKLDERKRKFVFPNGKRLSFSNAAIYIRGQHPNHALEDVKDFLLSWIDSYAPEGMTQEQLATLDSLLEEWADEIEASM
jgi:hypothetical protein